MYTNTVNAVDEKMMLVSVSFVLLALLILVICACKKAFAKRHEIEEVECTPLEKTPQ